MAETSVQNGHQAVTSRTGSSPAPVSSPLDDMFTGNIRGQSPVDGLEGKVDWEDSSLNTASTKPVSTGSGDSGTLGPWPIQNYGNNPKQKNASGPGPATFMGHHPGQES